MRAGTIYTSPTDDRARRLPDGPGGCTAIDRVAESPEISESERTDGPPRERGVVRVRYPATFDKSPRAQQRDIRAVTLIFSRD